MSARLLPATVGLATAALVLGYSRVGAWAWMLPIVALGGLWLLGLWRHWGWVSSVGFVLYAAIAAVGLLLDSGSGWMLLGVGLALAAWDLDSFVRHLRQGQWVEDERDLERRHLLRLSAVEGVGLLLATAALGMTLSLGFGAVLLLGLLAVAGLSRVMGFLRHTND
jgi:hypothetical protein